MDQPNWDAIQCFVCVAKKNSLTEASGELGLSVPTLGRRIDSLEQALALKLLRRGPDGTTLTPDGQRILALAEPGAHYLDQIARAARTMKNGSTGVTVRISSTEPMVSEVLAPNLPQLLNACPNIRIELEASTDLTNLNIGEADIAIRLAKPKSDTLVGRKLPTIAMGLYCSTAYLDGRETASLSYQDEKWLGYDSAYGDIPENVWFQGMHLDAATILRSGSVKSLLNAAKAGTGIAMLPTFLAKQAGLQHIPQANLPTRTPWVVFHRDTRTHKDMKNVRKWIVESCESIF